MIPDTSRATRELADGNEMPLLGLGVWQVPDGPEYVNAVIATAMPAVNQVSFHPFAFRRDLRSLA